MRPTVPQHERALGAKYLLKLATRYRHFQHGTKLLAKIKGRNRKL